jgi:anti-sigma B factor antagonist
VDLSIDVESEPGRQTVRLSGALDLQTKLAVLEAGQSAMAEAPDAALVLDLEGVSFIDSSGIGALVQLGGDADEAGVDFALLEPSARVVRILEVTGLLDRWTIEHTPAP